MKLSIILKLLNSNTLPDIMLGYEYLIRKYRYLPWFITSFILKRHNVWIYRTMVFNEIYNLIIHRKNQAVFIDVLANKIHIEEYQDILI